MIKGKASKPIYLFIHDGKIEIRDASSIWGKTVQESQEVLRQELGDERVQILCIGPAGERLVRFANVMNRHMDAGAGIGIGAVLGSKNLKAIVVRSTMGIEIKFPKEAIDYDRQAVRRICSTNYGKLMQRWGSIFLQGFTNGMDLTHMYNFQHNKIAESKKIAVENIDEYAFGMDTCFGCQLHCRYRYIIDKGPYEGVYAQGPGYESQIAWSTEVGCRNVNTILTGNYLANSYGFDILEARSLISWVMRLYEKGILSDKDTDGLSLKFGNDEAVIEMIHRIGRREGLGDILAGGALYAAQKIGKDSEKYLVNIKGLSCLNPDEKSITDITLINATSPSSPELLCFRPSTDLFMLPESMLRECHDKPYPDGTSNSADYCDNDDKPQQVFWYELLYMAADMIGMCKYYTVYLSLDMPSFEEFSKMLYLNAGLELSAEQIRQCAKRAYTLERLMKLREGAAGKDDQLLASFFNELAMARSSKDLGNTLNRETFSLMLHEYYRIHDWDRDGIPKPETLKELGLDTESIGKL